mmetsp:Transcript_28030/g.79251  ORF Transcript_28030/g.79251 Transcript_28030/m.79251 type:complete len:272 (-) Transcript_28030:82-897(-)
MFESTPGYLPTPMAPYRISKLMPEVKVVILLRDPVSRALSHWNMRATFCQKAEKNIKCPEAFEKAIAREITALERAGCDFQKLGRPQGGAWGRCFQCYFEATCDFTEGAATEEWFNEAVDSKGPKHECKKWSHQAGYVFRGMYAAQISWWLHFFHPSQIHVINQADMSADLEGVLRRLFAFLGLETSPQILLSTLKKKTGVFKGNYGKNKMLKPDAANSIARAEERLSKFYTVHNANLYKLLHNMGITRFSHFNNTLGIVAGPSNPKPTNP